VGRLKVQFKLSGHRDAGTAKNWRRTRTRAATGAITRALLDQLPARATLLVFEINPRFDSLQRTIPILS
jgi:chorismate synthase